MNAPRNAPPSIRPHRLAVSFFGVALLAISLMVGRVATAAPIKVSCIGEQTTHSDQYPTGVQPVGMQEYPAMLQTLLGAGYSVQNNGDCCASVIQGYPHSETHPYISGKNYNASVAFAPDIVVIGSWGRHDWGKSAMTALPFYTPALFETDYEDLVKHYLALPKPPKIFASLPIPIPAGMDGLDDGFKTSPAADAIKVVAAKYNLPIVDLFSAFLGHPELYRAPPLSDSEGEHVNPDGMMKIAQLVQAALTGAGTADGGASTGGQSGSSASGSAGQGGAGSPDASGISGSVGAAGTVGTIGTGGDGSGGFSGTGGSTGTGAGGSLTGTGGSFATGGSGQVGTGTGGVTGATSTGGQSGTAGPGQADSTGGCACGLSPGRHGRSPWDAGLLLLVGWVLLLRRGKRTRSRVE
jgi:hypothetical protein